MIQVGSLSRRIVEPAPATDAFWQMVRKYRIRQREPSRVIFTAQASLLIRVRIAGVTEIGEADPGGMQSFMSFMSDCLAASLASPGNCAAWQSLESPQSS